jgi:lysophospholipase L1-like esterase
MKRQSVRVLVIMAILVTATATPLAGLSSAEEPGSFELQGFGASRGVSAALSPEGEIWMVWATSDAAAADGASTSDLYYSRWIDQGWAPAHSVYRNAIAWAGSPSLAFDADGVAWVAWASATSAESALYVSRWTGYAWSAPSQVPAEKTTPNQQPVLAAAPGGGLWLAWVGFDGNDDEIYAAYWDGLAWSEPQRVSSDDADPAAYDSQPRLAVGPDGTAWLTWTSYQKFLDDEVFAARWDGQRWLPEEQVSVDADAVAASPTLAVAEDGTAWLAWHSQATEAAGQGRRVHLRPWTESAGWGAETVVSSSLESYVTEQEPCLGLGADGLPYAVWTMDGGIQGLGYARFDGARWSLPAWGVQESLAGSVCLGGGDSPSVLWWPIGASTVVPNIARLEDDGLPPLPVAKEPEGPPAGIEVVTDRHLAFGDSITWGQFIDPVTGLLVGDYPARLDDKLDSRVTPSEVINDGVPGERAGQGRWRLLDISWPAYQPQFIELLEGTNDLTHDRAYNEIAADLSDMVFYTKRAGSVPLLSTLLPRNDDRYNKVVTMNGYIANVAAYRKVPLVDNWQAFISYGDWRALLVDALHPNGDGMAVLADSWYSALLKDTWLTEDITPPTTWIDSLPIASECGSVSVQWTGTDNVSWVVDYDVQAKISGGVWTDWLLATEETSGIYPYGTYGDVLSFRVRGRDVLGNQNDYSGEASTTVVDSVPPYDVGMEALQPVSKAPFALGWWGYDTCTPVNFDVQCAVGSAQDWEVWLSRVTYNSAAFDPDSSPCGPAQYGETYYFRTIGFDESGRSKISGYVSTVLAQYTVEGRIYNLRHQPVAGAAVTVAPAALAVERRLGGYLAYLADTGDYSFSASHAGFEALPAMEAVPVAADLSGLDFVLPPLDDVVSDGGFEVGDWGNWQPGGVVSPTLLSKGHTGSGAVLLGGTGGVSQLSQSLSVPGNLVDATLSLLVRLDDGDSGDSVLQVELEGTSISHTEVVTTDDWTHIWLPVDSALGQEVTLVLSVSDDEAVRLDEVSLGSAPSGGAFVNMPVVLRASE